MLRDEMQELIHTGAPWHSHDDTFALWVIVLGLSILGLFLFLEKARDERKS